MVSFNGPPHDNIALTAKSSNKEISIYLMCENRHYRARINEI